MLSYSESLLLACSLFWAITTTHAAGFLSPAAISGTSASFTAQRREPREENQHTQVRPCGRRPENEVRGSANEG